MDFFFCIIVMCNLETNFLGFTPSKYSADKFVLIVSIIIRIHLKPTPEFS